MKVAGTFTVKKHFKHSALHPWLEGISLRLRLVFTFYTYTTVLHLRRFHYSLAEKRRRPPNFDGQTASFITFSRNFTLYSWLDTRTPLLEIVLSAKCKVGMKFLRLALRSFPPATKLDGIMVFLFYFEGNARTAEGS